MDDDRDLRAFIRTGHHGDADRAADDPTGRQTKIRQRALDAGIHVPIGNHTVRATGLTAYLDNCGAPAHAQNVVAQVSPDTTKLNHRSKELLTQAEAEQSRL